MGISRITSLNKNISLRYAKALFTIGEESNSYIRFGEEIETFHKLLITEKKLKTILLSPLFTKNFKKTLIKDIVKELNFSEVVERFLSLLINENRICLIEGISLSYRELLYKKEGKVFAIVTSALPLSEKIINEISLKLELALNKKIIIDTKIDSKIIGGLKISIGSLIYDGSINMQLEELRKSLIL